MFENNYSFDLFSLGSLEESIQSPVFSSEQCLNNISSEKILLGNFKFQLDPSDNYQNHIERTKKTNYTGGSNPIGRKKTRRKFGSDNILDKTNTHFLNFLVILINFLLKFYDIKEKFLKIDYKYKKIRNSVFYQLKNETLGDIIIKDISPKFRTFNADENKKVYDKIINIPFVKNLLSEKYIDIFINIFYKNKRIINLEKYDKNNTIKFIKLPKTDIKMFEDFLENEKEKESQEYIEKIKEVVIKKFIKGDN